MTRCQTLICKSLPLPALAGRVGDVKIAAGGGGEGGYVVGCLGGVRYRDVRWDGGKGDNGRRRRST